MLNKFGLTLAIATGLVAGIASTAQAQVIDGSWQLFSGSAPSYAHGMENFESMNVGSKPSGNVNSPKGLPDAFQTSKISATGNVRIEDGFQKGQFNFPEDHTKFATIFTGGTMTIALSAAAHYVGFDWGTIDSFNTVTFKDYAGNILASFTGTDVAAAFGVKDNGTSSAFANFTTNRGIRYIEFASTHNSFEVDNINVSAVPLPAALPLFGAALGGMGVFGRKRRKAQAA